jgi:glycosyltransferase involved in cell wall biosynthesis
MKDNPLCTIIVPTVGRPKYIGAALASVAAQTYRPLEILISDNATNPSVEIGEIQRQSPQAIVRMFRPLPPLLPPARHFNLCLKEARGEYVFIMGDDDLMSPGYIAASMECILGEPSVNAVIARQTRIEESFFGPVSSAPIDFKTMTGDEFVSQWVIERKLQDVLTTFPMVARRRQLLECGGLPEYPDASHSTNTLILQLCLGAKLGLLDGGYYYRIYPTSGGLATPWRNLFAANQDHERDLLDLYQQGRLKKKFFLALMHSNTQLLVLRWKNLYRHRSGFENKVRPVLDIAFRIFDLGWRHGLGVMPKLHKHFNSE